MPAPASAPLCASHKAGAAPPAGAQPPALSSSSERSVEEGDEGGGYRHSPTNTPVSPAPGRSRTLPGARSRSGLPPAVVTCSPPLAHRATGGGRLRAAASPLARRCLRGESLAVRGITLPPRAHDRWVRTAHGRRARPSAARPAAHVLDRCQASPVEERRRESRAHSQAHLPPPAAAARGNPPAAAGRGISNSGRPP